MADEREDMRLTDVIASYLEAVERGEKPNRKKLLARYPKRQEELRAFFADYGRMERFAGPLRKLACIGGSARPLGMVGDYELLDWIAEGGMGVIYRARQAGLDRTVALKMILAGRRATAEDLHRFRTEAKAAAAMNHPNIVPIYDYGEDEGQPYFTMGLIDGHTLDQDARAFRSDPREAVRLIGIVARAIHHAHQRKIIHRDLKPGNILIDSAGAPHVTDFGLAMTVEGGEGISDPDYLIGTLPYMTPEQLSEKAQPLTTSVDIWSLGTILYELLTGKTPFQGKNQVDTIDQIRHGTPAPMRALNPGVPRDLETICLKCLEKEPEKRYGSALALANDLERWLNREATRIERYIREARRTELRHELLYTSSLDADKVLMKLKDWSSAILEAAIDPELPARLRRRNPKGLRDFLDRVRRTFDDPARGFAQPDEKSPFESWILFDDRGKMIASSPHESIVGKDFSHREWYRGARDHEGKRGLDSVHVSRVFLSVVRKNLCKFTLSVPVYEGLEGKAPFIGVLGASFTTDSNLGLSRLSDERHKVVVVGRWDPDSYGDYSSSDYMVLVHPAYRRGEEAVKANSQILQSFVPKPRKGELRPPEPGQVGVVDEEFEDPLAGRDARYGGVWWAGIGPVGNTPFLAIVQRRPDPLIERQAGIPVGLLVDLTGATSSVSGPYAEGIQAYADWLNAQGGIHGKQVRLVRVDYANRTPDALEIYARFKTVDRVLAIQGWGTGDTEALMERVSQDQIPFLSASYSAHLADPEKAPYNFFVAADYSTQLRAGLKYLRDAWKKPRKPKVAFMFPDTPYGKSPIPAGKKYARELGFQIVGEEEVALSAIEAARQILKLKKKKPDFTWIGGTTPSTAVILKEARKQDFRTRLFVGIWGNDEDLITLAGVDAEGVMGLQASVLFGDDVPGMKAVREATGDESKITHYVRGWVSMMVLCEALRRAEERRELTGPGIKKALETLREFDTQGLMPPITYTADDHRPNMAVMVYKYSRGKMRHRRTVHVERRPEWLGF